MTEAVLHYNLGTKNPPAPDKKTKWLPPTKSLIRIGVIVAVFSVINGIAVKKLVK